MYHVADMVEAQQVKKAIVITLKGGSVACLFLDELEDANWLTWEINDAIAMQMQGLFEAGIHDTGARWGEISKINFGMGVQRHGH